MEKKIDAQEQPVIKQLDTAPKLSFGPKILLIFAVLAVLGIGAGYFAARVKTGSAPTSIGSSTNPSSITKGYSTGSNDLKTFKDTAEGTLVKGGIDGEGQYHLVRPGGDSQNVYLTSSSVDLLLFINKKIKVWGQTQAAQHAGWLMDVGRVEVQ